MQSCKGIWQKTAIGQAEQDPNLLAPSASYVLGRVLAMYNSPFFDRVAGQVRVPAGQVNFRGSLPRWASNVLEPMLYPVSFSG